MLNLKISFEEEERKVKYEKYFFNIPIPKEIKFDDISIESFNLEWKLDKLDMFDKNKIKYKVALRKFNENVNENENLNEYENLNETVNKSLNGSVDKSLNVSVNKSLNESVNKSLNESVNKSLNETVNESGNEYVYGNTNGNINEEFNQVYFGSNPNCLISNLKSDTIYEVKICCVYDNLEGEWSKIKNIKTKGVDSSLILRDSEREKELLEKIYEWSGYRNMKLLYRGTRDGKTCKDFHNKCDNKGPTICLYKSEKGYIFGGYSPISWKSSGKWEKHNESFIFTLTNIYDKPTKFPHVEGKDSVYHSSSYGPTFDDFCIYDNFSCKLYFPRGHKDVLGKGRSIFNGDNNTDSFNLKEIEVFKLFK